MANFFKGTQIYKNGALANRTVYVNTAAVKDTRVITYASNYYTMVFSANLITGNKINGKVNGTAISEVTYATSNVDTLNAVLTQIKASAYVSASSSIDDTHPLTTHTLTIYPINPLGSLSLTDWAVTAGASQATITITAYSGSSATTLTGANVTVNKLDGSDPDVLLMQETKSTLTGLMNADLGSHNIPEVVGTFTQDGGSAVARTIPANRVMFFAPNKSNASYTDFYLNNDTNTILQVLTETTTTAANWQTTLNGS